MSRRPQLNRNSEPVPRVGTGCHIEAEGRRGTATEPVPAPAYRYGFGCPPWRKIEEENLLVEDFCDL